MKNLHKITFLPLLLAGCVIGEPLPHDKFIEAEAKDCFEEFSPEKEKKTCQETYKQLRKLSKWASKKDLEDCIARGPQRHKEYCENSAKKNVSKDYYTATCITYPTLDKLKNAYRKSSSKNNFDPDNYKSCAISGAYSGKYYYLNKLMYNKENKVFYENKLLRDTSGNPIYKDNLPLIADSTFQKQDDAFKNTVEKFNTWKKAEDEKIERARLAAEKAEKARIAAEKAAEEKRIAAEKEKKRQQELARKKAAEAKKAAELEKKRLAKEKEEKELLAIRSQLSSNGCGSVIDSFSLVNRYKSNNGKITYSCKTKSHGMDVILYSKSVGEEPKGAGYKAIDNYYKIKGFERYGRFYACDNETACKKKLISVDDVARRKYDNAKRQAEHEKDEMRAQTAMIAYSMGGLPADAGAILSGHESLIDAQVWNAVQFTD